MKLENIGFYTLTDDRAKNISETRKLSQAPRAKVRKRQKMRMMVTMIAKDLLTLWAANKERVIEKGRTMMRYWAM